jgi:hypothetical protein
MLLKMVFNMISLREKSLKYCWMILELYFKRNKVLLIDDDF